jgi:hypothetical protein
VPLGRHDVASELSAWGEEAILRAVNSSDAARERAARNEALFRQVNERVKDVSEAFALDPSPIEFMCECGREDCTEPVALRASEYERVRSDPRHFFVLPSHVIPEVEVVVWAGEGYVIVEKLPGESDIAIETDPRSPS